MTELVTTAKKGVEECYFKHHIKLITPIQIEEGKNTFLIDRNILFQLHQWKVVKRVIIKKGNKCEIEFAEYSPFLYNSLVRVYKFDRILFHEKYTVEQEQTVPIEYSIEVLFNGVSLLLELDIDKVCPVYHPPKPKKRRRVRRRK